MKEIRFLRCQGRDIQPHLSAVATLRIEVFRAFPYLYEGTVAYEERYLEHYAQCPDSVVVLALDADRIVGAATGLPLQAADPAFQAPFIEKGIDLASIFYFGESVLSARYRGLGIGHAFFDHREAYARELGFTRCCFCAVERPDQHPLRPADYQPLDGFWQKRGYHGTESFGEFSWRDIDHSHDTAKPMRFWTGPDWSLDAR